MGTRASQLGTLYTKFYSKRLHGSLLGEELPCGVGPAPAWGKSETLNEARLRCVVDAAQLHRGKCTRNIASI